MEVFKSVLSVNVDMICKSVSLSLGVSVFAQYCYDHQEGASRLQVNRFTNIRVHFLIDFRSIIHT